TLTGMATDSSGLTLLLGGLHAVWHANGRYEAASLGDTWAYPGGGASWIQVAPTGPPYRNCPYLQYDSVRDRLVLAGGSTGTIHSTWDWDGTKWTRLTPP